MEIIKIEQLTEEKNINLFNIHYKTKDGKERVWNYACRGTKEDLIAEMNNKSKQPNGVIIFATIKDTNNVVLLKEFRIGINDYIYSLPAGMVDFGEDLCTAAKRELEEETGLKLISIDTSKNSIPRYSSIGLTNEKNSIVYGIADGNITPSMLGDNEEGLIMIVTPEQIKEILQEDKVGARTQLLLEKYLLELEMKKA